MRTTSFLIMAGLVILAFGCKKDPDDIILGGGNEVFTDARDGHVYEYVQIGDQVWMAENLAYLPAVSPSSAGSDTDPLYYVYDYQGSDVAEAKATTNYPTYGVLYNWPSAKNVCPSGWHLPNNDEWQTLKNQVGFMSGDALKTDYGWQTSYGNGNNSSGFSALPAGERGYNGLFSELTYETSYWSSTAPINYYGDYWNLACDFFAYDLVKGSLNCWYGFSVRCLKD